MQQNCRLSKHDQCPFLGLVVIIALISWISIIQSAVGNEIVDRIVAVVNNDIITYLELQNELRPYEEKIKASGYTQENERKMIYKVRNELLNTLIDRKLTDQEIKRYGLKVSDAEIDQNIEQIKSDKLWTDEEFREALKGEGMTLEAYRKGLKEQALRAKLVNVAVKSKIVITKTDIEAYYEEKAERYKGSAEYHLRNIIMKVPGDADSSQKKAIRRKMEDVRELLHSGDSFETLAQQYSESPLAKKGGDLGLIDFKSFSPQIQKALQGLQIGQSTEILDTDQGYQIFFIEDIVQEDERTLEEVYTEIERALYNEVVEKEILAWLEDLRKTAHVKIIQ